MTTVAPAQDAIAARRRLDPLLAHAWDRSPFYRELFAAHGIRRSDLPYVGLEDLPVVSKADLMLRFDEAVTDPRLRKSDLTRWLKEDVNPLNLYLDEYVIIQSSASAKILGFIPYTREAWRYMSAAAAPLLLPSAHGAEALLRSAFFFTTDGHFAGSTSAYLASQSAHDVLRLSVFDPVEETRARLNAFQPERLHSYASALAWLAEWTLQGKLRIAPRSVVVTGDRLSPAMRALLKAAWHADIYDLYASAESLYMALQSPGSSRFQVFTDLNVLEVVDGTNRMVPPGARGRVLLTSPIHVTLPIIRLDLHDYAVLGKAGLGAETLDLLDGKDFDCVPVRLANGSLGMLEVYEVAQLELPGVAQMQFVARSPAEVEIRYQSPRDMDAQIEAAFRGLLAKKSASVEKVVIRRVERILNDWQTFKLRRVIEPGQRMLMPASLLEDAGRASPQRPTKRDDPEPREYARKRRLSELLAHAWDHSSFYRELYAARGIRRPDLPHVALEDLPVVSKEDVMVRFDEAVTDPRLRLSELQQWVKQDTNPLSLYLDEYIIVFSSASSKIQGFAPHTRETWRYMTATVVPSLLPSGQAMETPLRSAFFFTSDGHFASATSASLASHSAHEVLRLSVFDPVEEVQARLNAFQPERLHSYASALTWLAEWTLQGKLRIAPRSVLVTGDRLSPAMRARVKEAWNADIYDLYASCESLYMAVQRPEDDEFQVFTDLNVLEVVDSANRMVLPGTRGRVLLTNLFNATLPLIRYDLHDYAVLGRAGLGAETFLALDGKAYDKLPVRLADGSLGALEVYELAQLELPGIATMQFVAHSPVEVEIRYQSSQDMDARIDSTFRRLLAQKSATVEKIAIRRVERILNDRQTFKLRRVIESDHAMLVPTSLAEDAGRASKQGPGRVPVAASASDPAGSVDQRFSQIASRQPEHLAALDAERALTYGQLERLAAKVAGDLLRRSFDPARPVAVFCAHKFELLPLALGVLRAGGFYLPLDPYLPTGRLQLILDETRPQFLLTCIEQRERAQALAGDALTVLCLEEMDGPLPKQPRPGSPDAPACLLYTSGTTGDPKGVVLTHATIRERAVRYATDYNLGPADRVSLLQSYAVSAGIREIFGALLSGATLALFDVRTRGIAGLARWVNGIRISVLYAVPTLFRTFLETLSDEMFPAVRVVRLGGEPPRAEDVDGFRKHFAPGCRLVNGYAASETDTICQYVMDRDTRIVAGRVPAGLPVAGVELTICDERGNEVVDALGEIRVAGKMLAAGYWDAGNGRVQPFDLPFATGDLGYRLPDGRIFLMGRRDLIVKIHGHRIHLGEIEQAVSGVPGIVEAAAVVQPGSLNRQTIVVFYVAAEGHVAPEALRHAVSSVVPGPAIPVSFAQVPSLPRLPGGKVNRSNLPAHQSPAAAESMEDPHYASPTEAALAGIWQEVLNVPAMAHDEDFFDLGGDSISVFRAIGHIRTRFGVDLSVAEFFSHAVLAELARTIDARR